MEPRSSLEYWERRWGEKPWDFATSWPDSYARRLELAFVRRCLMRLEGPVLDLGCGNLQLAEDGDLFLDLAKRGYLGMDGAATAVVVAEQRVQLMTNMDVMLEDFSQKDFELKPYLGAKKVLLSKRVLQNLTPLERQRVLPMVLKAEHGILIEGTAEHLAETNRLREGRYLDNCTPPAFNWYLSRGEVEEIQREKGARVEPFMSRYYYHTRGRDLRTWDSPVHRKAYLGALEELRDGQYSGQFGPVVAITW